MKMKRFSIVIISICLLIGFMTVSAIGAKQIIKNPGFEKVKNNLPLNWNWVGWFKPEVNFALDSQIKHSGKYSASISIKKITPRLQKFGPPNWAQNITKDVPAGKKIKMTGYIKTKNVSGNAPIGIQCWNTKTGKMIKFGTTQYSQPISGTKNWKKVTVEMEVPKETDKMRILCMLMGTGKVWFDEVKIIVIK
ncbi:MAG: hypothetical protein K8T10_20760 [Candidatus Eremiobacteraeota bacterium]|nr:hypothetical protein [Candidatus Eremiobacteraeota bacterium]